MADYAELIKTLRYCNEYDNCGSRCPRFESNGDGDCVDGLMKDAADAIEELLAAVPKWISVEERLPEVEQSVLFCVFGRSVGEGTYRGHDGFHHVWKMYAVAGTYWDDEVTHWMPLPAPPKGVE